MALLPARGNHSDTVFHNGSILTMDGPEPSYVEAVGISAGRIVAVGSLAQVEAVLPGARVRDLDGCALLPGFIDAHSHLGFGFDLLDQVSVAPPPVGSCTDIAGVISSLEAFRADRAVPEGGILIGWGYDQAELAERRHITAADLDAAFPDHRVVLVHVSTHGAVLNTQALRWAGVDQTTATPQGGVISRYEGTNEPSGLLMETAYLAHVRDKLPRPAREDRFALLDGVQQLYASNGYTHAQDGFTKVEDLDFFAEAAARGLLYLDVVALGSFLEAGAWLDDPSYSTGDYVDGFKIGGMKIVQDGSPQGRTACVTEPYLTGGPDGEERWFGESTCPVDAFRATVARCIDAGVQVFVHANGDATIDQLISAVDAAGVTAADDRRTVAIHSQFQRRDHLPEYARLGISPSYFTAHTYFWGDVHAANIGVEKASFISPMRSAAEHGLVISNHSDFTVTPLDPLFILWTSMTRTTRSGKTLGQDECITPYAALAALTTGAAHQMFEENRKGRIAVGLLADLVVLSADPLEAGPEGIRDLTILETIKEGVTVFARPRTASSV
ncbi:MAG: amidohydrolase [Marmoricola sp.]|nr:amidohydrolase [Marmoricola sp.]